MRVAGAARPRRERRRAGHPTRGRLRARTRCPPRHRARRRGRGGTSRRGRHAPGARRGPGAGRTPRRMCRRSSPRWSGGPQVEAGGIATGVELLTYHRAKGLEWDAVFLPALEEGTLPIRQSTDPGRARRGAAPALRRDHPGEAIPVAVVGHDPDGRLGTRWPAQPVAVPRWARAGVSPPGRGGRDRGAERPPTDRQGRPGRPVAALECAPCLAHGPCPRRRRRPIHRLPRLDHRGHRSSPAALDGGAAPRSGRRPDEARSLRRGDHRRCVRPRAV